MSLEPRSDKLCAWQYSVFKATQSGKEKRQQVVEAKRLAAVYDALRRRKDLRQTKVQECKDNAAGTLRSLATTWHREAQKTVNDKTYRLAHYMYREYLDTFPEEKDAYTMAFYYAELLFKLKRWEEAAEAYTRVVQMKRDGKFLKEAAYAAVISWKNALNVEEETQDTERLEGEEADRLKPRPLSDRHKKMIAAFDTYLEYVPRATKERPTILYRKARIYYEHNHYDKAYKLFSRVVVEHPQHELSEYAANLMLDCLNILKRYDELLEWLRKFKKIPALYQGELRAQIDKLFNQFERIRCETAQKDGRYRECGECYRRLASKNPDDPRWSELAYNSALCYEAAKLIGNAIQIRTQLINVAKDDPLAQKAMYMIGANYHGLAWYSRAAAWYERFAREFPGEEEAPKALQDAIVFRLGRAEHDKAAEDIRYFAKTYGKRPKYAALSAKVVFSLGTLYEQRNQLDKVIDHYQDYLRKWGRYGGTDRQVVAHARIGRALWRQSCPGKTVNGACIKIERVRSKREVKRRKQRKTIELRKQCGPETKNRITVKERDTRKVRQAMGHLKKALALGRRGQVRAKGADEDEIARRKADLRYAVAQARFLQAEALFEQMLEVEFPKNLDFSERNQRRLRDSQRRFRRYLDTKGKRLEKARRAYQDVIKQRVPHWAIAAAARIGQLFQNFAGALYTAPVPKPNIPPQLRRSREAREEFMMVFTDTYCDTLEVKARPLEDKAEQGLAACLSRSTELSWYNEWSKLCEAELNQINAVKYPVAAEIRAEPGYVSMDSIKARPITEIN
jgi:tetratricopeptide (TPR) repeat protein